MRETLARQVQARIRETRTCSHAAIYDGGGGNPLRSSHLFMRNLGTATRPGSDLFIWILEKLYDMMNMSTQEHNPSMSAGSEIGRHAQRSAKLDN